MNNDDKAQLKRARKLIDNGEYTKAKSELEEYLARYPPIYQALVLKGFACNALNDKATALECFESATQLEPNNTLAWRGILEICRTSQEPQGLERAIQALDILLANSQEPNKKDKWLYEKADYLFQLAMSSRQLEKAYQSGLLWKQLAAQSCNDNGVEEMLRAFRCFYLVEEIACQEATPVTNDPFSNCTWYALLSVANKVAIHRYYRGQCEELNQVILFLWQHFQSVSWTEEDLEKFVWRQKLQLVVQFLTSDSNKIGEDQTTILEQWEWIYRFRYPSRYASLFLDMALECYWDDFIYRPNERIIQQIWCHCQRAIRESPWQNSSAYFYLVLNCWLYHHRQRLSSPVRILIMYSRPPPTTKTVAGYIIYYWVDCIRMLYDRENVSTESILSRCKEAIEYIQQVRKHRLCSFGHMEYIFRMIRCVCGSKPAEVEQNEDWQWLQQYPFALFEPDWQRLEWTRKNNKYCKLVLDEQQLSSTIGRFIWNEIGKQRWMQDNNRVGAMECWNTALSLPLYDEKNDVVWSCFQAIRKSLGMDDQREKSRTMCLFAFHYLSCTQELEKAEKLLIQATQNDVSYELPFALLGFLFEYLSLHSSFSVTYLNRAIKCYQRCLVLYPFHAFASWRLYRLYSKTQNLGSTLELLQYLTNPIQSSYSSMDWPYIILGTFQLALGDKIHSFVDVKKSACTCFQTGIRYRKRNDVDKQSQDSDLFSCLEPLLGDTIAILQSQCMESTAWFGLCDAYAAEGRLSAALASCTRGLSFIEKTSKQPIWTPQQLEMIHRRQFSYRVKKGHLLALLNRLDEAAQELESIANPSSHYYYDTCWKRTLGQVYWKQALVQYWSGGLYQRALRTMEKAIVCFALQNTLTDLALVDLLGTAIVTRLYLLCIATQYIDHSITQYSIRLLQRMLHRYPQHTNIYVYWAFFMLLVSPSFAVISDGVADPGFLSRLAKQIIYWSRQSMHPKHLLMASFTASLLLATEQVDNHSSNHNHHLTQDKTLYTLSLLAKLPANKRYSHLFVSLLFAALWLPLEDTVAYAFIQDALRRDPCKNTAWLLLGMWREGKEQQPLEDILSCYLEAIRLAANPIAVDRACRILYKIITNPQGVVDVSLVALCFALAYQSNQYTVQRELLPWLENVVAQREETCRQEMHHATTKWQIQRGIHQMPHLCQHYWQRQLE